MGYVYNPSSWETDVGKFPRAPGLQSETKKEGRSPFVFKDMNPMIFPEVKFKGALLFWEFSLPLGWNSCSLCSQGHITWLHLP